MIKRDMDQFITVVDGKKVKTTTIPLTPDEIRTITMFVDRYRVAQALMRMAQELEAEYMQQLRAKHELDDQWVCNDVLDGFVKVVTIEESV